MARGAHVAARWRTWRGGLTLPHGGAQVPWTLERSIWGPRKRWCDAGDFYDTQAVRTKRLEAVWDRALRSGLYKCAPHPSWPVLQACKRMQPPLVGPWPLGRQTIF